jgi:hypothetical protein
MFRPLLSLLVIVFGTEYVKTTSAVVQSMGQFLIVARYAHLYIYIYISNFLA